MKLADAATPDGWLQLKRVRTNTSCRIVGPLDLGVERFQLYRNSFLCRIIFKILLIKCSLLIIFSSQTLFIAHRWFSVFVVDCVEFKLLLSFCPYRMWHITAEISFIHRVLHKLYAATHLFLVLICCIRAWKGVRHSVVRTRSGGEFQVVSSDECIRCIWNAVFSWWRHGRPCWLLHSSHSSRLKAWCQGWYQPVKNALYDHNVYSLIQLRKTRLPDFIS